MANGRGAIPRIITAGNYSTGREEGRSEDTRPDIFSPCISQSLRGTYPSGQHKKVGSERRRHASKTGHIRYDSHELRCHPFIRCYLSETADKKRGVADIRFYIFDSITEFKRDTQPLGCRFTLGLHISIPGMSSKDRMDV